MSLDQIAAALDRLIRAGKLTEDRAVDLFDYFASEMAANPDRSPDLVVADAMRPLVDAVRLHAEYAAVLADHDARTLQ